MPETVSSGVDALSDAIAGRVFLPGDADFDRSQLIWNGTIDRDPAVVARCTSPEDVAAALAWAQQNGMEVAVRGGGHNVTGSAVAENGLTIDLSELRTSWTPAPGAPVAVAEPRSPTWMPRARSTGSPSRPGRSATRGSPD